MLLKNAFMNGKIALDYKTKKRANRNSRNYQIILNPSAASR
jgi:hypothetical protein